MLELQCFRGKAMKFPLACCVLLGLVQLVAAQTRFTTTGDWGYSLGYGYAPEKSSIWTSKPGATATFTPNLTTAGSYRVWFYVVRIPTPETNENAASFEIRHAGQTDTKVIDTSQGVGRWESLGIYSFQGGAGEYVRLSKSNFFTIMRAVAMKFDRLDASQKAVETTWVTDLVPFDPVALASGRKTFTDMAGSWASESATTAVAKGWMSAGGSTFNPNGPVTKAEFATALAKVIGKAFSSPDGAMGPAAMLDLAIAAAKQSGKNLGFAAPLDGVAADVAKRLQLTKGPADPAVQGASVTRAQAAAVLARLDGAVMQSRAPAGMRLGFHDEFDAPTLNEAIWYVYDNIVADEAQNARFRANVEQRGDGLLRLINKKETRLGKNWTAGMLETKGYLQRYGYFEARMKLAPVSGLDQAFWMRNKVALNDPKHFEIDTVEAYFPNTVGTTLHQQGMATIQKQQRLNVDLSQDYHTFSVSWNPTTIIYYVDGVEVDRKTHAKANDTAVMILSSAVMGWAGPVTDRINGSVMLVDWVRSYTSQ